MADQDQAPLLGLPLARALRRLAPGQAAPLIVRTAPPRPRRPLPESDDDWRIVRVDAGEPAPRWIVAPAFPLPEAPADGMAAR